MDIIKKQFNFQVKQLGDEKDRVLRFVGSTEDVDRDSDIIEVAGWKYDSYMKNPVVLWAHNSYSLPPIAKTVKIEKDIAKKKLMFDIKFPTLEELSTDVENPAEHAKFVDMIYNMCKNGYLNATSVGFKGIKFKTRDDADVLDKPEWQRGRRYIEQELTEISIVNIPANQNALIEARGKGLIDDDAIKSFFNAGKDGKGLGEGVEVYFCDDEKAQKLLDIARKYISVFGIEERRIVIDGKEKDVFVEDKSSKSIRFGFDHLDNENASITVPVKMIKTGARFSKETIESMKSIMQKMANAFDNHAKAHKEAMKCYKGCMDEIKDMMGMDDDMDEEEGLDDGVMDQDDGTNDGVEEPKGLEGMLKKVLERLDTLEKKLEPQSNDANKVKTADGLVIDLDAIEFPKTEKNAAKNELPFEPEEFKKILGEIIDQKLKAATGKI